MIAEKERIILLVESPRKNEVVARLLETIFICVCLKQAASCFFTDNAVQWMVDVMDLAKAAGAEKFLIATENDF